MQTRITVEGDEAVLMVFGYDPETKAIIYTGAGGSCNNLNSLVDVDIEIRRMLALGYKGVKAFVVWPDNSGGFVQVESREFGELPDDEENNEEG